MAWDNKIVSYGSEDPEQLLANPGNWRIHTYEQEKSLEAVLDAIGWIADVAVNVNTGNTVDGHLRIVLAIRRGEPTVPVRYLDLTLEEEAIALATFDYLSKMAITDGAKLEEILEQTEPMVAQLDDPKLGELADMLREEAQEHKTAGSPPATTRRRVREIDIDCPECGCQFTHDLED
jgi:hypothetical protein